jgi:hypothetical protein
MRERRAGLCYLGLVLAASIVSSAWGAEDDTRGGINFDMAVNYGSAYRSGTWVPVDVIVNNREVDINGWLELRCLAGNDQEGPTYRVPAECPKGSVKRFRFTCCMQNATKIEAMLYQGRRRVLDFPPYIEVRPIDSKDLLGLILDEEALDYGFLNDAVTGGDIKRFHRESLNTDLLPLLSEQTQCYDPVNVIVMGDIDPNRIGLRQREVLAQYVRNGGVLVVCLGENAKRYRGTWVEGLLGVEIGPDEIVNEPDIVQELFTDAERNGAREDRRFAFTRITPQSPLVRTRGEGRVVAALNPLGSGYVATVAVDASSRALQSCAGYINLWRTLCLLREERGDLNFQAAFSHCANSIPYMSGVNVYSRGSVVLYLLLYFGLGIVGNWLFWNRLKRRELAWVTMIFVSVGFTLYAAVFGTVGRAKASEVEQVDVVRVPQEGGLARLHSIVGVLTARTSSYNINILEERPLVRDLSDESGMNFGWMGPNPNVGMSRRRPFRFVQDTPARIEDFAVGASVLRLVCVESETLVPGPIQGELVLDDSGLSGLLTNQTGYTIRDACVFLDGEFYDLSATADGWQVKSSRGSQRAFPGYGYDGGSGDVTRFMKEFPLSLVSSGQMRGEWEPNITCGPYLCGWSTSSSVGRFEVEGTAKRHISETLVVADIKVERRKSDDAIWREIRTNGPNRGGSGQGSATWRPEEGNWSEVSMPLNGGPRARQSVQVFPPSWLTDTKDVQMTVTLYSEPTPGYLFRWKPAGTSDDWAQQHTVNSGIAKVDDRQIQFTAYRIDGNELSNWLNTASPTPGGGYGPPGPYGPFGNGCSGEVSATSTAERPTSFAGTFILTAKIAIPHTKSEQGELSLWR